MPQHQNNTSPPSSSSSKPCNIILLQPCDDESIIFRVTNHEAQVSTLISNCIEYDNGDDEDDNNDVTGDNASETIMHLPNVKAETLQHIIQFMKHYYLEPMSPISAPFDGTTIKEIITQEWYASFVLAMDKKMLFQIISGANYMDIEPLLNLGSLFLCTQIMGKSAEEIRLLLEIEKMSVDEELKAREENSWMFS